jgi:hypothetical protein
VALATGQQAVAIAGSAAESIILTGSNNRSSSSKAAMLKHSKALFNNSIQ